MQAHLKFVHKFQKFKIAAGAFLIACVNGCTSTTDATLATAGQLLPSWARPAPVPANPNYQYLRVIIDKRTALMVLGEVDQNPLGPIEVFYSAEAETLKFQNGRIVGSAGLTTNWVGVTITPIPDGYERIRDIMPGYRFGVRDQVRIRQLTAPPREIRATPTLSDERIKQLRWTEEASENGSVVDRIFVGRELNGLPRLGYQCIEYDLCLQWERL